MSVNGGDFRFAAPPNPGTVRVRVGFTDCGESSGTAGTAGSAGTAGTAGSATSQPPVLLLSIVFGLPELVVPRGVRQISTDSELLSAVFSNSRALQLQLHRFSILYEPTVHLTDSDSCLSAWGGQVVIVGVTGIALLCSRSDSYLHIGLPVTSSSGVPSLSVAIAAQISSGVSNSSCGWTRRYSS